MSYKRTLVAICVIITLGSTSCAVDSVPGVEGTIFRFSSKTTFCYTPNSGRIVDLALERDNLGPYIACLGPGDTIICRIFDGIAQNFYYEGLLYGNITLGKYVPFESRFELIPKLADTAFFPGKLDYDRISKRYLFLGRLVGESEGGLYVLDTDFDIVHDLTPLVERLLPKNQGYYGSPFFLSNGNIIISRTGSPNGRSIYELDTTLQTCNLIARGRLQAVSTNKDLAIITTYGSISLYDINTKTLSQLPLETRGKVRYIRAYCFSPDDRYIAYSVRENNFRNTIRLHIYDLVERKDYETAPIGVGPLLWLPIEPPAEFLKTAKKY